MPIISRTDRKSMKGRAVIFMIYTLLILGGLTMVFPFSIMLTGSMSTYFDYERRSPLPRFLVSRTDRFMRVLSGFAPPSHRGSIRQLRSFFPSLPEDWQMWSQIGDERQASDAWASAMLAELDEPDTLEHYTVMSRDYGEFLASWDLRETVLAYDQRHVAPFLRDRYDTLDKLNAAWEISIDTFSKVSANEWSGEPIDQHTYVPLADTRYTDLLAFRQQYRDNRYTSYLDDPESTATHLRPAAMAYIWEEFATKALGITDQKQLAKLPFPVPDGASMDVREAWLEFLEKRFPLRHIGILVNQRRQTQLHTFLQDRFRNVSYLNRVMLDEDPHWPEITSWDQVKLTESIPDGPIGKVWMDFVQTSVPVRQWSIRNTLPEKGFQAFLLSKYKSLSGINKAYGLGLPCVEQLRIPYKQAVLVTFNNHDWDFTRDQVFSNYVSVFDELFRRGRAAINTLILVVLAVFVTLTVNPLAGYALSRFRLRQSEKILVFCLATMAFPTAVAAIPGFLLLRDLGLLNTFAALVLPGAANGMTIFLLKGFFDSLPQDLFEAATIDGAPEWRIFLNISLPLVKPILAVSALNAFILAYNGWAWAIIVCQDPKLWTMAVWTYQFSQTLSAQPFTVMAAFILNSIPVLIVFLFCQKIILRGIILPQLK
ncbi:MAG: carbohydrate ABC transporter permease [Lentisphaeria bacterium]|nr:carbohydrate ABC transporter permease [Lentisphaeria bacterium]